MKIRRQDFDGSTAAVFTSGSWSRILLAPDLIVCVRLSILVDPSITLNPLAPSAGECLIEIYEAAVHAGRQRLCIFEGGLKRLDGVLCNGRAKHCLSLFLQVSPSSPLPSQDRLGGLAFGCVHAPLSPITFGTVNSHSSQRRGRRNRSVETIDVRNASRAVYHLDLNLESSTWLDGILTTALILTAQTGTRPTL